MIQIITLITLTALSLVAASNPAKPMEERQLQGLAQNAKTAPEHLEVASLYESRGHHFETKAVQHEQYATKLAGPDVYNPLRSKWPAMAQAPIDRARSQAMRARRAAGECFAVAAQHKRLAAKSGSQTSAAGE